jgi:hypothetical protein
VDRLSVLIDRVGAEEAGDGEPESEQHRRDEQTGEHRLEEGLVKRLVNDMSLTVLERLFQNPGFCPFSPVSPEVLKQPLKFIASPKMERPRWFASNGPGTNEGAPTLQLSLNVPPTPTWAASRRDS